MRQLLKEQKIMHIPPRLICSASPKKRRGARCVKTMKKYTAPTEQ